MRVFVIVNHVAEIGFRQTTALLIAALTRNNCQVSLANVDGLSIHSTSQGFEASVIGVTLPSQCVSSDQVAAFAKQANGLTSHVVTTDDLVLLRTNPGRDLDRQSLHASFLHLVEMVELSGVRVVNAPRHLSLFANKASLSLIDPRFRPTMLVTPHIEHVCKFVRNAPGNCVVKPLLGSRGQDVIRVTKEHEQLEAMLQSMFNNVILIAQHFVEANHPGDRRIVVLDGEILEVDGHLAGIERHPVANDFRANLHAGGIAHPIQLNHAEREAARHAAQLLFEHGIRLAGVDLIGNQVIELNVFSTGGLFDANRFAGTDFAEVIVSVLLSK